jgi:hypothetical protein
MSNKIILHSTLSADLGNILSTGATPHITLYSDADGVTKFTDSDGNTHSDKVIASLNYTEPHNDADNNQIVNGFLLLTFTDGTSAKITDTVDTVYYGLVAVAFKSRTF